MAIKTWRFGVQACVTQALPQQMNSYMVQCQQWVKGPDCFGCGWIISQPKKNSLAFCCSWRQPLNFNFKSLVYSWNYKNVWAVVKIQKKIVYIYNLPRLQVGQIMTWVCPFDLLEHIQAFILACMIISCVNLRNEDRIERSEHQTCTKMDSIEAVEEQWVQPKSHYCCLL